MDFSPTCSYYNEINNFMEVYSLPCQKKRKKKKICFSSNKILL